MKRKDALDAVSKNIRMKVSFDSSHEQQRDGNLKNLRLPVRNNSRTPQRYKIHENGEKLSARTKVRSTSARREQDSTIEAFRQVRQEISSQSKPPGRGVPLDQFSHPPSRRASMGNRERSYRTPVRGSTQGVPIGSMGTLISQTYRGQSQRNGQTTTRKRKLIGITHGNTVNRFIVSRVWISTNAQL